MTPKEVNQQLDLRKLEREVRQLQQENAELTELIRELYGVALKCGVKMTSLASRVQHVIRRNGT